MLSKRNTSLNSSAILFFLLMLTQKVTANHYPTKPNRYSAWGWNKDSQECYLDNEVELLNKIKRTFSQSSSTEMADKFFNLKQEKMFFDNWVCNKPLFYSLYNYFDENSYTLPILAAKDPQTHPLGNFATNMAKRIANKQSERSQATSNKKLLNDPTMLVFEELKNWFFETLANKKCDQATWEAVVSRQRYLKDILHILPNFGLDRLYLHDIQLELTRAADIITQCLSTQELPSLLSELIVSEKNLENTVGTYLHFLLIDEPVSDNYLAENLNESPFQKIYKAIGDVDNKSKSLTKTTDTSLSLRSEVLNDIRFANFVTAEDKNSYLEAIAILDTLSNIRKIFEDFQIILPRIGTYLYSVNYIQQINQLSTNYINLVTRLEANINKLLSVADVGLHQVLSAGDTSLSYFEKNLKSLETKIAQGTTVSSLLKRHTYNAITSMQNYHNEVNNLVHKYESGEAKKEISQAMEIMMEQIHKLNEFVPLLLNGEPTALLDKKSHYPRPDMLSTNTAGIYKNLYPEITPTILPALQQIEASPVAANPLPLASGTLLLAGVAGAYCLKKIGLFKGITNLVGALMPERKSAKLLK